jgi:signal peptidase I
MKSLTLLLIPLLFLSSCSIDNAPIKSSDTIGKNTPEINEPLKVTETLSEFNTIIEENKQNQNYNNEMNSLRKLKMSLVGIRMNWSSMYPLINDNTIVKINPYFTKVDYGDVVLIQVNDVMYIKRLIAKAGDTLRFSKGKVFIKKSGNADFIEQEEPYLSGSNLNSTFLPEYITQDTFLIPENSYWVMWDNRQNSSDSRTCFRICSWESESTYFLNASQILGIMVP